MQNTTNATGEANATFRHQLRSQHVAPSVSQPHNQQDLRAKILRMSTNDVKLVRLCVLATCTQEGKEATTPRGLQQVPTQPEMQVPYETATAT